jgi:hypothetical protein
MAEVITDWHANTKNQAIGVAFKHGLHVSFGLGIEALVKVGGIFFGEANAGSERMGIIVLEDASGGVDGAMNITLVAKIDKV